MHEENVFLSMQFKPWLWKYISFVVEKFRPEYTLWFALLHAVNAQTPSRNK